MKYKEIVVVEHLLLEYKREKTAQKMGARILAALSKDQEFLSKLSATGMSDDEKIDTILDLFEKMDPTVNKQFVQWLVKNYGQFGVSNANEVKDTLEKFTKLKTQIKRLGKSVDINSYNYKDLSDMIKEITRVDVGGDNNVLTNYKNQKNIKILYSGAYGKLLIPETEKASCEIGSGTSWCTAATKSENSFHYYTEEEYPGSKLYVWIDKSGEKYQFHFESAEFKDSSNEDISDEILEDMVNKHPVLSKFFQIYADAEFKIHYLENPSEEIKQKAVRENAWNIQLIDNPSDDVLRIAFHRFSDESSKSSDSLDDIIKAGLEKIPETIRFLKNPTEDQQLVAMNQNPSVIEHINNPAEKIQFMAVKTEPSILNSIKNPTPRVQMAAVKKDVFAILGVEKLDPRVQLYVVEQDPDMIEVIKNPTKEARKLATKKRGY